MTQDLTDIDQGWIDKNSFVLPYSKGYYPKLFWILINHSLKCLETHSHTFCSKCMQITFTTSDTLTLRYQWKVLIITLWWLQTKNLKTLKTQTKTKRCCHINISILFSNFKCNVSTQNGAATYFKLASKVLKFLQICQTDPNPWTN